jgi:hypothetical protein
MNFRSALLGSTAILGATALFVPSTASAFDVNIRGFLNFDTVVGDLQDTGEAGDDPKDYDFRTDSEIHIEGVNIDDETGIRYGMMVEFETDGDNVLNTDEAWLFVDGGFGGFRFGDDDGALDNSKISATNIAAGTGGIDGQGVVASVPFAPTNSGDSTKIRYDSPSIAGFTLHGSFTSATDIGENIAQDDNPYQDWVEAALVYTNSFGALDLQAGAAGAFNNGKGGQDDFQGWNFGAIVGFSGIQLAASYWQDEDGPEGDKTGVTAGAAASLGPADLSLTYAGVIDSDDDPDGEEGQNIVLSATMGILPGMSINGDVSWFDRDADGPDDGVAGVVRLRVAF